MKTLVLNQDGSKGKEIEFPKGILSKTHNFDLVHQFISTYVHNSHQKTKAQKNRSAVRGGGRKPWRQKGTGRARAGTIRSPIWRSGGVTFAHVFNPSKKKKVNKKMYRAALRSIFSRLIDEDRFLIINNVEINEPPKTSQIKKLLSDLKIEEALFVLDKKDKNFELASNNLINVKIQTVNTLNPVELINAKNIIFTLDAVNYLDKVLSK
tara:strand:+ start:103 stop:729 length:627 start_codon:yes stop_codon:yes gene_type:complete